jgi:predicted dehydrogenase
MKLFSSSADSRPKVRYAVVGLGYIAQSAVLPAFDHARSNSKLAALVSDDPEKLDKLGKRYRVKNTYSYDAYDECLRSGNIDAVYIALPNNLHKEYSVRAAAAGIHVLCEKPMAVTETDCKAMIDAAEKHNVKLMVAYRLHFESANLAAIEMVKSGEIGDARFFISSFSQQVKEGDIRLKAELGGGSLYDMGIYCLNAARYIFQAEPYEVMAFAANNREPRFRSVDEMLQAQMRFPEDRLASFISSFGSAETSFYRVIGTKGDILLEPAYEYSTGLHMRWTVDGKTHDQDFPKRDQFAPELLYFSECVLRNKKPQPSGHEGLADVRVIQALYRSALSHQPVTLGTFPLGKRPNKRQEILRPPVRKMPTLVNAEPPSAN